MEKIMKKFIKDVQLLINKIETAVNDKKYKKVVSLNKDLVHLVKLNAQELSNFKDAPSFTSDREKFYETVSWAREKIDSFKEVIIK